MIPIAGETNSGIRFIKWTRHFKGRLAMDGRREGWAFQRADGICAKASDHRTNLFQCFGAIQDSSNLIDLDCNVWEDYGVQRSGR